MAKRQKKTTKNNAEAPTLSCLLICDDVQVGIKQNKHVLQGVIGKITVASLPAIVGPYVAYVRLSNVYASQDIRLSFMCAANDEEVFNVKAKSPSRSDPLQTHTLILKIPQFEIANAGRHLFSASHGDVPFAQSPIEVSVLAKEE